MRVPTYFNHGAKKQTIGQRGAIALYIHIYNASLDDATNSQLRAIAKGCCGANAFEYGLEAAARPKHPASTGRAWQRVARFSALSKSG
jgi:hypothetical protein